MFIENNPDWNEKVGASENGLAAFNINGCVASCPGFNITGAGWICDKILL